MSRLLPVTDHEDTEEADEKDDESQLQKDCNGVKNIVKGQPILSAMLICIPMGFVSQNMGYSKYAVFVWNSFSILPMAWLIGKTTEDLSAHTNQIMGGLINATFGNIVEMLLCVAGIQQDQLIVVKCTLIGSILSNLMLVMGTSFIWGGMFHKVQNFSQAGAGTHCSLLLLSVLGLALPTVFAAICGGEGTSESVLKISRYSSILLFIVYCQYLWFQLKTHAHLFEEPDAEDEDEEPDLGMVSATVGLGICTVLTTFCTEYLIGSIEGTIESAHISKEFIGIIILPIIGNAAEHYTAITVAGRNKMDLSLGVAVGSSCQMALLVTPLTVLFGWGMGKAMSLDFHPFHVTVLLLSVLIVCSILQDGQSNWLEGTMLVTSYIIIAMIYYFAPASMESNYGQ